MTHGVGRGFLSWQYRAFTGTSQGHPGVIWHQREGAIHFLYIVISTMTMATLWRSGPSPGELYRDTYILWVAEIAEEAAWPQVPSSLSKSHIICFSTEPMKMTILLGSNTTATEYKDAMVMTCCTNVISTQWLFNGLSLQLRESTDVSWCSRGDPHRVFCALGSSHDGIQDCGSQCHSMEKRKGIV